MPSLRSLVLLLALLLGLAPGARARPRAPAQGEEASEAARRAAARLALSERQNFTNHKLALQTAREALALWQTTTDRAGLAGAYAQVAQCHFAQSELPEAVENYEAALRLLEELGDFKGQAGVLIMLGFIEARRSEWAGAINFLTRAEGLLAGENAEPRLRGQIAGGLAHVFEESGMPESGLVQYQQALNYFAQMGEAGVRDRAMTRLVMGGTHRLLGNYDEALSSLSQALRDLAPGGVDEALCRLHLGRVYLDTGDYGDALKHLQTSLRLYESAGNPKEAAQARALLGQVYEQQGQPAAARRSYGHALATFERLSDRINQAAVLYALGRLELGGERYGEAENYLRQSIEVTENLRRVPTSRDLTAAFSATVHERYESYVECLMRQHAARPGRGFDARAFETSELALARSLAESLRATQTSLLPGLDPQLAEREKSLRQALRAKEDYKVALLGGAYRKEELAALEAELAALEAEYRQVVAAASASSPAYERTTRPAWDLRRVQEQVVADDETVLLEYSLGESRSYVWAVTRSGFASYELPARARINEAARKVYGLLAGRPPAGGADELNAAAAELGRLILSPAAAELNKRRVIVVADGALRYVPFQILPSPAGGGEPLVAGYEIVNAPSASVLGELRQEAARRPTAPKLLAAFGNPAFESNYALLKGGRGGRALAVPVPEAGSLRRDLRDMELKPDSADPSLIEPLFYSKRELANLAELTAGGETLLAEEFAATRERLLTTDLTRYSILHFATHGLLDPKQPEKSGLMLSTIDPDGRPLEGFVALPNIYGLRAPVDLVVLSACRTALGKDVRGEGLLGLTRGFMYAGASSVVASLWKVEDEATAELMKLFYANMLREGMAPAAALRAAQNALRQRPGWNSPYYWAAFTLQGEYRRVIKPAPAAGVPARPWKVWAGGALLTLAAGGAWWSRRRRRAATRR